MFPKAHFEEEEEGELGEMVEWGRRRSCGWVCKKAKKLKAMAKEKGNKVAAAAKRAKARVKELAKKAKAEAMPLDETMNWWWLTQHAYTGLHSVLLTSGKPSLEKLGWDLVGDACMVKQAKAKVFKRKSDNVLAVAFAGTDFYSVPDWKVNFMGGSRPVTKEGYPEGFQKEVTDLEGCIAERLKLGKGKADYIIGHSQGGADAVIYWSLANSGHFSGGKPISDKAQVVTFGAPKTTYDGSCSSTVPGHRWYHQEDNVPGNIGPVNGKRLFDKYHHNVQYSHRFWRTNKWNIFKLTNRLDHLSPDKCHAVADFKWVTFWLNLATFHATYDKHIAAAMKIRQEEALVATLSEWGRRRSSRRRSSRRKFKNHFKNHFKKIVNHFKPTKKPTKRPNKAPTKRSARCLSCDVKIKKCRNEKKSDENKEKSSKKKETLDKKVKTDKERKEKNKAAAADRVNNRNAEKAEKKKAADNVKKTAEITEKNKAAESTEKKL